MVFRNTIIRYDVATSNEIIHRVRAMWSAVSRRGVFLLFRRDEMKRAHCNASNENPRLLGAKFGSQVKAYTAAVHHLPHARIIVMHLQHVIRTFRMLSNGNADVLRKPFPCKTRNGIRFILFLFLFPLSLLFNEFHEFLSTRAVYLCYPEPRPTPVANRIPTPVASSDCNKAHRRFSRVALILAGSKRTRTILCDGPNPRSPSPPMACTANEKFWKFSSLVYVQR